jgi:hypothetical protein
VLKQSASELLVKSIHKVYGDEIWLAARGESNLEKCGLCNMK